MSPYETRITIPGDENICWVKENRAALWSFLLNTMFHNTELREATRKSSNCAEGISHTSPGGVVSQGPGNVWKAGTTLIDQEIVRVTEVPRRKKTDTTVSRRRQRETSPKDRLRRRGKEMHSTAGIHSCPAPLPPWRQFGRQGKEKAGHEKMWVIIKRNNLCNFQLLSCCVASVSFPQWRMDMCYWAEVVSLAFVFDLIEMAHDIWAIRKRSI